MIEWIKRKWREWRSYEECGKWFNMMEYCTRRHNHRGHHKETG